MTENLHYTVSLSTRTLAVRRCLKKKKIHIVTKQNATNKFTRDISILIILTHPVYNNQKQISHLKYKSITIFFNFKRIIVLCLGFRRIFVLFSTLPGFLKTLSHLFPMP